MMTMTMTTRTITITITTIMIITVTHGTARLQFTSTNRKQLREMYTAAAVITIIE